jgi:GH35 family endo-1,4-beta-xylanase
MTSFALVPAHAATLSGTSLLPGDADSLIQLSAAQTGDAVLTRVSVSGHTFTQALHVVVNKTPANPWETQLQIKTAAPIQKGDAILATFFVRAIRPLDGSAEITPDFEVAAEPYTKSLSAGVSPGAQWEQVNLPFNALDSYGAGNAQFNIMLGSTVQTLEFGGFSLTDYGPDVKLKALPHMSMTYPGEDANASWRAAAQARIEKYRKGDITVVVVDSHGKPVRDADVTVKMTRHAFNFGTAVADGLLLSPTADADTYRKHLTDTFNKAVTENDLKWQGWVNPNTRQEGIAEVDWLNAHGFAVRGHNLIWPSWQYLPKQLHNGYDAQVSQNGADAAKAWLAKQAIDHITDEVSTLKGKCVEWDVVNEPVYNHELQDILGPNAMASWDRAAHAADPQARLFLNDDTTFLGVHNDSRFDALEKIVQSLQDSGAPIGGIGLESHVTTDQLASPENVLRSLDSIAKFGLPLQVTEYDFRTTDKKLQADYTRDFMTVIFSHPSVIGFVMWGFWDGRHWLNDAPIYNKDWTLKPSGNVFTDLVFHQWWTDAAGSTDSRGTYKARGFLGDYSVTVTRGVHTKTVTTKLTSSSAPVRVELD